MKKFCSILLALQTIWYVILLLLPSQERFRLSSLYFECHKAHGIHNKSLEQFWKYFDMFPKIFTSFAVAKVLVLWFLRRGGSFFKEIWKTVKILLAVRRHCLSCTVAIKHIPNYIEYRRYIQCMVRISKYCVMGFEPKFLIHITSIWCHSLNTSKS